MTISADFESGNIVLQSESSFDVVVSIRPDTEADDFQWFYFRDEQPLPVHKRYRILNASNASYTLAWLNYRVLASYDEETWFRVPTRYDGSHLIWEHASTGKTITFAFFVPYTSSRRQRLVADIKHVEHVSHEIIGTSLQNRPLDMLVFGDQSRTDVARVWVVARQHAGEPMAEFAAEGLVRRLADTNDQVVQQLLQRATVYVVLCMNPDGAGMGNLRANAAGVDLNRNWHDPDNTMPELQCTLQRMSQQGVDCFIDLHGDETRPYLWFIAPDASVNPRHQKVQAAFEAFLAGQFPEVQPPPQSIIDSVMPAPGLSVNYITRTYDCPSWVVELPFKETPVGDTLLADGCIRFGETCVDALMHIVADI